MKPRRVERVGELLKQKISQVIIAEMSDPRMGFVTVTKVEAAPDLRSAKVYVSILGTEGERTRTLRGLRHAHGFIQRLIGEEIELRNVPALNFVEDPSVKRSIRISRLINEVMSEEKAGSEDERKEDEGPPSETDADGS
jgi:ribosome-binding factor A